MKNLLSLLGGLTLIIAFLLFGYSSMKYARTAEGEDVKVVIDEGTKVVLDDPQKTAGDQSLTIALSCALLGVGLLFLGTRKKKETSF